MEAALTGDYCCLYPQGSRLAQDGHGMNPRSSVGPETTAERHLPAFADEAELQPSDTTTLSSPPNIPFVEWYVPPKRSKPDSTW